MLPSIVCHNPLCQLSVNWCFLVRLQEFEDKMIGIHNSMYNEFAQSQVGDCLRHAAVQHALDGGISH